MTTLIIVLVCCAVAHGWLAAYFSAEPDKFPVSLNVGWRASWLAFLYACTSTLVALVASLLLHRP